MSEPIPEASKIENKGIAFDPQIDNVLTFVNEVDARVEEPNRFMFPLIKSNEQANVVQVPAQVFSGNTLTFVESNIASEFSIAKDVYITGKIFAAVTLTAVPVSSGSMTFSNAYYPFVPGLNVSVCADPFSEIVQTAVCAINNTQVASTYMSEAKDVMLELANNKKNQELKAGPFSADYVAKYDDAYLTPFNTLGSCYESSPQSGFIGNGVYPVLMSASAGGTYASTVLDSDTTSGTSTTTCVVYVQIPFNTCLSGIAPFSWNDVEDGLESGLRGVKRFDLTFTLNTGSRLIRSINNIIQKPASEAGGYFSISSVVIDPAKPFGDVAPILYYTLISPPATYSLLPSPLCITKIIKNERGAAKIQTGPGPATVTGTPALSNTNTIMTTDQITLTKIPRYIVITASPNRNAAGGKFKNNYSDYHFTLDPSAAGQLTIQWNNNSVLNSQTLYDFYRMYRAAGGQNSWLVWSGQQANNMTMSGGSVRNNIMAMKGPVFILRVGIDIPIGIGYSPNSPCDLKFKVTMNVKNQTDCDCSGTDGAILHVWNIYDEFLISDVVSGQTKIAANIITPAGLLAADKEAPAVTDADTTDKANLVGGSLMHRVKRAFRGFRRNHGGTLTAGSMSAGSMDRRASHRRL